jgi:hypothetical protein
MVMRTLSSMYWFAATLAGVVVDQVVQAKRVEDDELNSETVEKLATFGCSACDMADRFLVSEEFIRTRFPDELRRGWARHRIGIRQAQWLYAIKKGGALLLTWLGRNSLGQSHVPLKLTEDEPEVK